MFAIRDDGLAEILEPEPHETLWAAWSAPTRLPEDAVVIEWVEE